MARYLGVLTKIICIRDNMERMTIHGLEVIIIPMYVMNSIVCVLRYCCASISCNKIYNSTFSIVLSMG